MVAALITQQALTRLGCSAAANGGQRVRASVRRGTAPFLCVAAVHEHAWCCPGVACMLAVSPPSCTHMCDWCAEIRDGDKRRWLGSFTTGNDAGLAYDAAAVAQKGNKAKTNFMYRAYETNARQVRSLWQAPTSGGMAWAHAAVHANGCTRSSCGQGLPAATSR